MYVSRGPLEELEFSEFVREMEEICSVCVNITLGNYKLKADDLFPESASVYIHRPARKQLMLQTSLLTRIYTNSCTHSTRTCLGCRI
jgi:type III secretory pathway lipoprotein EscJ